MKTMDEYQKEQFNAHSLAVNYMDSLSEIKIEQFKAKVGDYLNFRKDTGQFLEQYFSEICVQSCYQNGRSACCSKEGIITFFADILINALLSTKKEIEGLKLLLKIENKGFKCIYLGEEGCVWRLKPIICDMFLCDQAKKQVFEKDQEASRQWDCLKKREKGFTWPDRPVLFDDLEAVCIQDSLVSPLMYLHNSPGLLRVKKLAQNSI
jgi:hypothetical protein